MRGIISAYQLDTMELLWRFEPGNYGYPAYAPPIVENGIVYVGTVSAPSDSEFGFFALNAATGQEIWRKVGIQTYSSVLEGDFIYVYDGGGVHKIRKDNGSTVWHTNFGSSGAAPIAYGYGFVYAPHSGAMRILDAETGEIVHMMSPPDGSFFWLVTADKGRIFAQSSRHLYAFAPWGHEEALE
jgi:outer membrane protein assembly factor BamB